MKLVKAIFCLILVANVQEPVRVDVKVGSIADRIDAALTRRSKEGLGGAIVVEKDGVVILKAGYGWANRAEQIPFSTSTIAQVGSLTKQFTATAIVDLASQKKLSFNDPIEKYLDEVPQAARSITIHQLLTHTAGLMENCGRDFDRLTRAGMISNCLAKVNPPGKFLYSNLGYSLLAAVVERVTHKSLDIYLTQHFFQPLGMKSTGYFFPDSFHRRLAFGYTAMGSNPPISDTLKAMGDSFWNLKGNGGIQASVDDMYVWYRALAHGPNLTSDMRKVLTTPYVTRDDGAKYGYGWFVRTSDDGQIVQVSHTGSDEVFLSVFVWRPVEKSFFYFVTNNRDKGGAELTREILQILKDSNQ